MCLLLHPLVYEVGGTFIRSTMGRSAKHDPFKDQCVPRQTVFKLDPPLTHLPV